MQFRETWIAVLVAAMLVAACGDGAAPKSEKSAPKAETQVPEINPALLTAQVNSAPLFESQGTWSAGYLKARGKGPGVVVGPGGENPNVFAQQFPAKPGDPFKVVARASSVDKAPARGRFQINWLTQDSKFLVATIKAFDVAPEERQFEHVVVAPPGAAAGTLYVVGDGPDSVVRYTEMRILGKEPVAKAN
jgi:hypothetical protein